MTTSRPAGFLAALVVLAAALLAHPALSASTVAVSGSVTNGTEGFAVPPTLEVTVARLTSDGEETTRRSAAVDGEGGFRIEGFEGGAGSHLVAAVTYRGVTYSTVADAGASSEVVLNLRVFETTEDDSVISVAADTLLVARGPRDVLDVVQRFRIANGSDRTFVGRSDDDARAVVRLPLPPRAFDIAADSGLAPGRVVATRDGLATGEPLQPGDTSISYGYRVRVPASGWVLRREVVYPTERAEVLVGIGLELDGPALSFAGRVRVSGRSYRRFEGGPFGGGSTLTADITPSASSPVALWAVTAASLVAILAVSLLGSRLLRPRRRRAAGAPLAGERERVIEGIVDLDEAFSEGAIGEPEYGARRSEMKERLAALSEP